MGSYGMGSYGGGGYGGYGTGGLGSYGPNGLTPGIGNSLSRVADRTGRGSTALTRGSTAKKFTTSSAQKEKEKTDQRTETTEPQDGPVEEGQEGEVVEGAGEVPTNHEEYHQHRRTFILQAIVEMSQVMGQVVIHTLRSVHDLMAIVLGSYFGYQKLKEISGSSPGVQGENWVTASGLGTPTTAQASPIPAAAAGTAGRAAGRSIKSTIGIAIITFVLFALLERLYQKLVNRGRGNQSRNPNPRRITEKKEKSNGAAPTKQVVVAKYSYVAQNKEQLSFNAGDKLIVDQFDPESFCLAAFLEDEDSRSNQGEIKISAVAPKKVGYVPGNYLEVLNIRQKF